MSKKTPSEQLIVHIQENDYTINTPTAGNIIDVESRKQTYSNNKYGSVVRSGTLGGNVAASLIEAFASFTVFIPDFRDNLRIDSLFELNPIQCKEIIKVYEDKFLPWYSDWMDYFSNDEEEQKDEKEEESSVKGTEEPSSADK